jgi:hypothetical protein
MKVFLSIFLLAMLFACKHPSVILNMPVAFKKPVIIQPANKDTVKYMKKDFLDDFFPVFEGKHKFTDTLFISIKWTKDTTYRKDFIWEYKGSDTDSFMSDGFEVVPDYSTTVYRNNYGSTFACYPVYIINQTPTIKEFFGKDDYLFGLEEALDSNKGWGPIEGRGFDFCGNGYWGLKVHPHEFLVVLFPKNIGTYKTKLIVRIRNGHNIYVSNSYEGTINKKQFYLTRNGYLYGKLVEDKASAIRVWFYGSQPLETYDTSFGRNSETPLSHRR